MNVFKDYSRYYDLLYRDKDYAAEADYISKLLKSLNPNGRTVLELGCGTGKHARLLLERGFQLHGIDRSPDMIEIAQRGDPGSRQYISFQVGDIQTIRIERSFDFVISLFHVMSYQTSNDDFEAALATAYAHLLPAGYLVFDAWFGPGVLRDPPVVRVKRISEGQQYLLRIAEPTVFPNQNVVQVDYTIFMRDGHQDLFSTLQESHRMRYVFVPEIELMLSRVGFRLLRCATWMKECTPDLSTWNVVFIAQK